MVDKEMILVLDEVDSTNSWLKRQIAQCEEGQWRVSHGFIVSARMQTAGRGQRGNSWEAAPGMNLTLSALLQPVGVKPSEQFSISEAVALATADTVDHFLAACGSKHRAAVKWPNDIYVGDRKVAGILIEHVVSGHSIQWSICGVGLNVNQTDFQSDAPNPVSLAQLGSMLFDLDEVLRFFAERLMKRARNFGSHHREYLARLWRGEGYFPYRDVLVGETIEARIVDVASSGILTLELRDATRRSYAFKEVQFLL